MSRIVALDRKRKRISAARVGLLLVLSLACLPLTPAAAREASQDTAGAARGPVMSTPIPDEPVGQDELVHITPPARPPAEAAVPAPQPEPASRAAAAEQAAAGSFGPLKVLIDEDGMAQIGPTDLESAGWDLTALDPRTIRLTHQGVEVPLRVAGQADGVLDPGDVVVFYGQAMTGPYTRRNVYWLTAGGAAGLRMAERDASPTHGFPVPASFPATLHAEQDNATSSNFGYWQNPPGKEAQDHWYWTGRLTAPATANLAFQMPAFDATGAAPLRVKLAGATEDTAVNPDHHTRLLLNGTMVSDAKWDGQVEYLQAASVSAALLSAGANQMAVESPGDTGATVEEVYANWLEVDYAARYVAQADKLAFGVPAAGSYQFRVTGFTSGDVEAYDLTNPAAPVRMVNVQSQAESGSTTAVFEDAAMSGARYLALTPAQRRAPAGLAADQPSDLHNTANGADEIILTYDGFYNDVLPLAARRQAQGLRVKVVRITDVYDEFSAGLALPQAIKDFLNYAHSQWARPTPAYVLFVGDANLDYLDRFLTGRPNFVPTHIFDAVEIGQTANDTWFAQVDGAAVVPDMYLGRLPARSSSEVQAMVAKIEAYETTTNADWQTRTLFVADTVPNHERISEIWAQAVPGDFQVQRVYAAYYPPGNPTDDLVGAINQGTFLTSYIGHGNYDRWGTWSGGRLFDATMVPRLTNGSQLPVVVTADCLNGFFVHPYSDDSMAEALVRKPDGGGIAVWSSSALGSPGDQLLLFQILFDQLLKGAPKPLGYAATETKRLAYREGASRELIETFTLFGDPAIRLRRSSLDGGSVYLPMVLTRSQP